LRNTEGALKPESVSTKQERIAKLAAKNPAMAFTSLNHYLDAEWLRYAYERTRKDGAVGVDGQTGQEYAAALEPNLQSLLDLRELLARRVTDGVVRRMIDKWLKAGVLEQGQLSYPNTGTPQGGVISPMLSNVFLHYVLDEWFAGQAQPRLRGGSALVRYCDDFVMLFARKDDAERVQAVLGKRLAKFGLELHPDKTRLIDFRPPAERIGV
jgi:hypothetical protein